MDRQQAYDTLLEIHNAMTDMLFSYGKMGSMYATSSTQSNPLGAAYTQMDAGYSAAYLAAQQEQILNQLDSLKPEEYEKSYKEAVWQTETGRNQIIYGAQSLYITAISLERSLEDGSAAWTRSTAQLPRWKSGMSYGRFPSSPCWSSRTPAPRQTAPDLAVSCKSTVSRRSFPPLWERAPPSSSRCSPCPV